MFFLLRLTDSTLSTDYCHVFKLFLLVFLGWVGVTVSRRLEYHVENNERYLIG